MKRILIVEDEAPYRNILSDRLSEEGYQILIATNGRQALHLMRSFRGIGLILLDLIMPEMDGLTFYSHLKNTVKFPPSVILLTNLADAPYPKESTIKELIVKANTSLSEVVEKVKKHYNVAT